MFARDRAAASLLTGARATGRRERAEALDFGGGIEWLGVASELTQITLVMSAFGRCSSVVNAELDTQSKTTVFTVIDHLRASAAAQVFVPACGILQHVTS
ncbi:hypothetical protein C0Q70_03341 [Pomacea canaliculata]|uniref:Uncharacterized protein n=1 Tax=Pomacea canaliculata TaxID=400727 RepID=A0A2T7PSI6_POMCA|nr:hypothetical protein C0Q70_03341 [Pomacea canaliculata]